MLRFQPIPFHISCPVTLKKSKFLEKQTRLLLTSKLTGGYLIFDKRIQRFLQLEYRINKQTSVCLYSGIFKDPFDAKYKTLTNRLSP